MLPKRRRTATALSTLSTALDSLRAKIHSFVDTADEEQLRKVAQLIDRFNSSNNGPFRLLDLPYELLEYTAERYFTRKEAAPILPVNKVFNELFANRVWKRVRFDNMKVNGCYVPMDVLVKNAQRVRTVELVGFIEPDFSVSGYFRCATSIAFELKDDMEKMFTLHLEQMKCLCQVSLTINDKSYNVIDASAKWIDDSHRSGHVQQIMISAVYSPANRQVVPILASLMDKINFKKRIRLDCGSLQPFPTSIVQFMPVTLTSLSVAEAIPTNCRGEINKQVFGTNSDSVFVHLQTLHVQVCCNNPSLYDFQSFVPERFPVLSHLTVCVLEKCCNGDADSPLATIFFNKQWPSITDLRLIGNETKMPEADRLLLRAMPALQECTFQYMIDVDISSGLDRPLTISRLNVYNAVLNMSHLCGKLTCLVCLELNELPIDSNDLQFIASCKRLVTVRLTDCGVADGVVSNVYKYPCNSVRKVVISKGKGVYFTNRITRLLPAFPKLRVLDLTAIRDVKRRTAIISMSPNVKILT
ncbi:hypothetical protein GQ42DRAFT_156240 [Ramicandelaber brevisporus]|nr:hypothetical protein GQ42DRAFT_156240 [Ramicandelaber brevisporus]